MTVLELIAHLSAFDPELRVITKWTGEGFLEDVTRVQPVEVHLHDDPTQADLGRHREVLNPTGTPNAVLID